MKAAGWLALGIGAGLGALAACFSPPELGGPYLCSQSGTCALDGYSCVLGVCCKHDGGTPACSSIVSDGGQDGGQDAGQDGGTDGGCQPEPCVLTALKGLCRNGQTSCATGDCIQTVFPRTETCNSADDDCNGVDDDYPCRGGPHDVLVPDPDWVVGAAVVNEKVPFNLRQPCLLNDPALNPQPEYLDAGRWRGSGVNTHFFYVQKADGGTWDLSPVGAAVKFAFSGAVYNGARPPFTSITQYPQPVVYACGPGGSRRYNPTNNNSAITVSGDSFFTDTSVNLATGGGAYAFPSGSLSLSTVSRIEVLLNMNDPFDGGVPYFDAGITVFGFSPP
jgi:hypothetical protein